MADPSPRDPRPGSVAQGERPPAIRIRCTFCHDGLARGEAVHCAACLAPHHADCHAEHGRCAAPGCDDRRVLVPDPSGRPARVARSVARGSEGKEKALAAAPGRSRRAVALVLLLLAVVLLGGAALGLARGSRPPSAATAIAPPLVPEAARPAAPAPKFVLERPTRDVALVASDFRLPLALETGARLVVETGEGGYTHVVEEPAPDSGRAARARFVASPGDPVEVTAGRGAARERFRAGPGEAIVLDEVRPGVVRIAVVPADAPRARRSRP